jgi:hypothetical protein
MHRGEVYCATDGAAAMRDYEFEVTIVTVVRVQAENEDRARQVIASSALGSPGSEEINAYRYRRQHRRSSG